MSEMGDAASHTCSTCGRFRWQERELGSRIRRLVAMADEKTPRGRSARTQLEAVLRERSRTREFYDSHLREVGVA